MMTREQAIALAQSNFWEKMTQREIAIFQLFEEKLCMPFGVFHEALEASLGRPVYTHELGLNVEGLRSELMNGGPAPSLEEIIGMIPSEKMVILVV